MFFDQQQPNNEMNTMKSKLRARRMWANECYLLEPRADVLTVTNPSARYSVRVAVIPLNDPDAMIARASTVVSDMICTANISDICRAVLLSSGVLPKPRKGGRK